LRSIHDFAIASVIEKLRSEGKIANNNHPHGSHNKLGLMGRIPDIIVDEPQEFYEVEVLNKRPLPKQNGAKRVLLIVTSLDWDEILLTSNGEFREASEFELTLYCNFQEEKRELDTRIASKHETLSKVEKKLAEVESRLVGAKKEYQKLSNYLSSIQKKTKWGAYLQECLEREKQASQVKINRRGGK
jgi:hypothetical protein